MSLTRALTAALTTLVLLTPMAADAAKVRTAPLTIDVLSNRADLISAGDALVAISYGDAVNPPDIRVGLGGSGFTNAFAVRENGRFEGLVTGLGLGPNTLQALLPSGQGAALTITNHPVGGPIFSGPQVQPWKCQATAQDDHCNEAVKYEFQYMSTTGSFNPYDPANPPGDVATTTTDEGKTVPFIIRTESGYQDRDQYQISVLYDPAKPWTAWAPQPQWNHKLLITHGASCGIEHQAGTAPGTANRAALGRGFAVMSTALDNAGHNCNIATEAESLVMA